MRCPACGFISFDHLPACKRCGISFPPHGAQRRDVAIATEPGPALLHSADEVDATLGPRDAAMRVSESGRIASSAEKLMAHEGFRDVALRAPGGTSPSDDPTLLHKAGFWIRGVAFLVDMALAALLASAGTVLVGMAAWVGGTLSSTPDFALEGLKVAAGTLLSILVGLGYFTLYVGWRGQTPGKMLLGLKIIRVTSDEVGYIRAFVRFVGQVLGALPLGIGLLMIAFSRRKQGLHDKLAGTYVIRLRS